MSKIQNFFANPAQMPRQQQPAQPPMQPMLQLPVGPDGRPIQPQGQGQGGGNGGDIFSSLLKNDSDGSSILSKIVSLFGG